MNHITKVRLYRYDGHIALRDFNRLWLARKFLTFVAWARTILKR